MNFSFLLVFLFDRACRTEVLSYYIPPTSADSRPLFFIIIVTLMFIAGVGASLCHAFTKGPKDILSETLMKFSAMFINGFAGVICGLYLLKGGGGWIVISPVWNIFMGVVLLYQIGFINNVYMDQKDASFLQIILGVLACTGIFFLCHQVYKIYWAITFSLSVTFTTNCIHFLTKGSSYVKGHFLSAQKPV